MEDLNKEVQVEDSLEKQSEPAINLVKVFHGLGKNKKPDPFKILYYGMPDGSYLDAINGGKFTDRPHVLDHLTERPILNDERDIISAIMNGVFNDQDYDLLEKNNMLSDISKQLWVKVKKLKELTGGQDYNTLVKSLEKGEGEEESDPSEMDADDLPETDNDLFSDDDLNTIVNGFGNLEPSVVESIVKQAMSASMNDVRSIVISVLEEYGLISGSNLELDSANSSKMDDDEFVSDDGQEEVSE